MGVAALGGEFYGDGEILSQPLLPVSEGVFSNVLIPGSLSLIVFVGGGDLGPLCQYLELPPNSSH